LCDREYSSVTVKIVQEFVKMKIIVGSKNPVKINAVKRAFEAFFPEIAIVGIEVASDVSDQPMNIKESYQGAYNRAEKCLKFGCDFGVGIEGGLEDLPFGTTTCGIVVILGKDGIQGVGTSARMVLPEKFVGRLKKGQTELGHIIDEVSGEKNLKQKGGMFGLFSKGIVTREEAYYQAVVFALSRIVNPDYYK